MKLFINVYDFCFIITSSLYDQKSVITIGTGMNNLVKSALLIFRTSADSKMEAFVGQFVQAFPRYLGYKYHLSISNLRCIFYAQNKGINSV